MLDLCEATEIQTIIFYCILILCTIDFSVRPHRLPYRRKLVNFYYELHKFNQIIFYLRKFYGVVFYCAKIVIYISFKLLSVTSIFFSWCRSKLKTIPNKKRQFLVLLLTYILTFYVIPVFIFFAFTTLQEQTFFLTVRASLLCSFLFLQSSSCSPHLVYLQNFASHLFDESQDNWQGSYHFLNFLTVPAIIIFKLSIFDRRF